jgi:hypothetical protein
LFPVAWEKLRLAVIKYERPAGKIKVSPLLVITLESEIVPSATVVKLETVEVGIVI